MRKYFLELFAIGLVDSEGRINTEHMTSDALMTAMKTMEELTQMKMDRLVLETTMEMIPDCSSVGGSGSCHSDTGPPCSRLLHCRYQAAGNLPERGRPQQQGQRFHPPGSAEYAPLL